MSIANFLRKLKAQNTIGPGIRVERVLPIREFHLQSDGSTLTTTLTTNPGFDVFETNLVGLTWAAAKVVPAGYTIQIPEDYDEDSDSLIVKIKCLMAGASDTPTIAVAAYVDDASTTDLGPDAITALSATATWKEIDLSGNSLTAGDIVQLKFTPAAHGSDAIEVYGMKMEYKSFLTAFSKDNR
jgi:hypothetical protein